MHRKHVIDPGTEVTEGSGVWGVGRVSVGTMSVGIACCTH